MAAAKRFFIPLTFFRREKEHFCLIGWIPPNERECFLRKKPGPADGFLIFGGITPLRDKGEKTSVEKIAEMWSEIQG